MERRILFLTLVGAILISASAALGTDRLVPNVYPTIQAGIDAAEPGDTVIIAEDVYTGVGNRDLDFGGKVITVRSTDPNDPAVVAGTVIDCENSGRGFYFQSGETSSSIVAGLTIANGYADYGGGIRCVGSSPTIRNCILSDNSAEDGGGMENESSSATVTSCIFTGNNATFGSGGGMCNYYCAGLKIANCIFSGNSAWWGGAIADGNSSPVIINCTFNGNSADTGGGIANYFGANPTITNCILWGDSATSGPEIYGDCVVSYCDVQGGHPGTGNIDGDPCFVDASGGDYHLSSMQSPCFGAGDPAYSPAPGETDIDGDPRVMGLQVDMGADEFNLTEPYIALSATEFEFTAGLGGANPAEQILYIWNGGAGTLNWQISEDCGWLSAEPNSSSSTGEVNEVTLSVDISGLAAGSYYCELIVSDPCALNSPRTVDVNLTVTGPIIELSSQQFEFTAGLGGSNPNDQILTIRNSGQGTLNWQITEDCGWLSAEPNSGSSTGEANEVTLSVDVSGLSWGNYNCVLAVSDPNAQNSPQMVSVNLIVQGPVIELSSQQFEFTAGLGGSNPNDQILTIRNSGQGTLNWQITEDCGWLSVEPNSGSSTGEANEVTLSVDVSGLGAGSYYCELTISDPCALNSPRTVYVDLTVTAPIIELSTQQFQFTAGLGGPNPDDQILTIRNSGQGTLNWQISEDCNWLSVQPNSGSSTGEVNEVTLSVDISGLGWGNYNCELTVSDSNAENSPQTVVVNLTVYVPGALYVPSEYPTIQAGIDAAFDGDTVIVEPNTYTGPDNRDLDFGGKVITVQSTDPNDPAVVAATIIDCNGSSSEPHRGFYFHSGEGLNSIVAGFTIKNGYVHDANGGGICCIGASPRIENCVISNCTARGRDGDLVTAYGGHACGGGIFCASDSDPRIIGCTISSCRAIGGVAYDCACPNIDGGDASGGGVFCGANCGASIIDCTVSNNQVVGGTGGRAQYDHDPGVSGDGHGGGIFCGLNSGARIVNCTVSDNQSAGGMGGESLDTGPRVSGDGYGGGIHCASDSSVTITNCRIRNNEATGREGNGIPIAPSVAGTNGYGGGICCDSNSNPTITNCEITGNRAIGGEGSWGGLGIYSTDGGHAFGGGIYSGSGSDITVEDCNIGGNTASGGDGGIGSYNNGDGGGAWGGGLCCGTDGTASIKNCLIADNNASGGVGGQETMGDGEGGDGGDAYGGGMHLGSGTESTIENCTTCGNMASGGSGGWGHPWGSDGVTYGWGIYCDGGSQTVNNCILWYNDGNDVDGSGYSVTYSCTEQDISGTGNIHDNPLFVTGPEGDYYLSQIAAGQAFDSPCVDVGSSWAAKLGMNICSTRTDGVNDVSIVDMGYHYGDCNCGLNVADIDGDLDVDFADYALFAADYAENSMTIPRGSVVVDGNLDDWTGDVEWVALDKVYAYDPNDVEEAWFALQWDADANKVYAAVIVEDSDHAFLDEYVSWDASDRLEVYSQGDAEGGSGWTSIYDVAQQYMVGPNTAGGSWATWGQGEPIGPDAGFEYAVTVSGDEIVYEVGLTQFDNYGGFSGGETVITDINVGSVVGFDLVVDTRWSDGFGMLSENMMPAKFNNADSIAIYMLVEESGGPPCFERVADLDGNCAVNWDDLAILVDEWLWGKE